MARESEAFSEVQTRDGRHLTRDSPTQEFKPQQEQKHCRRAREDFKDDLDFLQEPNRRQMQQRAWSFMER